MFFAWLGSLGLERLTVCSDLNYCLRELLLLRLVLLLMEDVYHSLDMASAALLSRDHLARFLTGRANIRSRSASLDGPRPCPGYA